MAGRIRLRSMATGAVSARPSGGGYARRTPRDKHFIIVTQKGHAYLDRLMRCE
jgi:hypothetical protein